MASPNLPVNVDASNIDSSTDPTVKTHQQHHDVIHTLVNRFDATAAPTIGQVYQFDGTVMVPTTLPSVTNAVTGDGTINRLVYVTSLPTAITNGTMYAVPSS